MKLSKKVFCKKCGVALQIDTPLKMFNTGYEYKDGYYCFACANRRDNEKRI